MKKTMKVFLTAVSVVVVLAVLFSAGLSVMTYMKVNALEAARAAEITEQGNEGEDDIKIGGQYYIRSTKEISDAYLSGDSSSLSEKDKETLDMASDILDEIITEGMSDYDKEQAVFLWMHEHIGFDEKVTVLVRDDTSADDPHGVLSSRIAVCVGYATTFRLLMQMLDIPCMVVHDTSLAHSWDLVQIGDHWYHTDVYSAQNEKDPLQLLNRSDDLLSYLGYEWDRDFYPAADSLEYCYVYRDAKKVGDVYAVPDCVKKAIEDKESFVSLILPAGDNNLDLIVNLMLSLESRLMGSVEYQHYSISHAVTTADGGLFLYIKIDNIIEDTADEFKELSDAEQEKIDKAISDSFGELTDLDYDGDMYYSDYAG